MEKEIPVVESIRQIGQIKRASNRETSAKYLQDRGIEFQEKNEGAHLIVKAATGLIDFWPGTGLWIARSGQRGRGVKNLVKFIGKQANEKTP